MEIFRGLNTTQNFRPKESSRIIGCLHTQYPHQILFSPLPKTKLSNKRQDWLLRRRQDLPDQQGTQDCPLPDPLQIPQKQEGQPDPQRDGAAVHHDLHPVERDLGEALADRDRHPFHRHIDQFHAKIEGKADRYKHHADQQQDQLPSIAGQRKVSHQELGKIYEVAKDRRKDQLRQIHRTEPSPFDQQLYQDINAEYRCHADP